MGLSDDGEFARAAALRQRVAKHFKMRELLLMGRARTPLVSWPRQVAMYLARRHTRLSFPEIGALYGGRDHTTVIYAVRKVTARRAAEPELDAILTKLEADEPAA